MFWQISHVLEISVCILKPAQNPGNLANSEASASEDTTPIPPRPTLKQKFSSSAPV